MNKFLMRVWLLLLLIGGMWFAPVAQASTCPIPLPSTSIPVLHVAEPITDKDFDVREKGSSLEIHNLSSDVIVLIAPGYEIANAHIDPTGTFVIDIHNAGTYMGNIQNAYCGNGGIPDGEPVPQNIHTQFTILIGHELVNVPINIVYEANPDYARELRDYQESEQRGQSYINFMIILGILYSVGYIALLVGIVVAGMFFLRWVKRRADERWE
jgi:hypothetical protein